MAKQFPVKSRRKLLNPVFHLQTKKEDENQLTKGMIKVVRKSGQLNLSGRSLASVPPNIFHMYDLEQEDTNVDYSRGKCVEDSWWSFKPLTYIDLSSNVIRELPGDINIFEDLTVLNLHDNSLTTLPKEIGALTKLTKLNLSRNKINKLPNEIYKLTELQLLNLSHNQIESIAVDVADLVMLQHLDLSHNLLTNLPSGMGFLVRLLDVNLSYNKLTELPPDIVNLRALQKFDVTHNDLKKLPKKLGELRKLQFLYAQHNDIEELPDFDGCEHLEQLYLGNNFIKEISKEFCESLLHLKILDMRDNQIERLPDEIAMLHHLIRIDLTNNKLTTLPNSMGLLSHLQNLQLEGNKFKNMRQDLIKGGTVRILKHLRDKFNADEIETLPVNKTPTPISLFPDKYVMRNSKTLNLVSKDLTNIPETVFGDALYAEVTMIDFSQNKFQEIPAGLKIVASKLTELNCNKNLLKNVPDFLTECVNLQYLDLGNNLLTNLPEALSTLNCLRELVLSNNRLHVIPNCVYNMTHLEILLLSDNQINEIKVDGLMMLKRLATLDLSNNNIQQVPPELGNVKQLRHLELKGNSFRQPRYAILEQGTESILSYLRDRIPRKN